ncbi:MAG: 2-iminoacetate synthase ThiH [Micromonosporaceae bacterium]|nr:2-iminoacetate synthase ThiH [Micromonosporaceae bacterium]
MFASLLPTLDLASLAGHARQASDAEVTVALRRAEGGHGRLELSDLAALLSPAAARRLEETAQVARTVTLQRFGRVIRLFAPLYCSNHCLSSCVYCGFARSLTIARRSLTVDEVEAEARLLVARGFGHLLLVAGEHRSVVSPDYLVACVRRLRPLVPSLSIETQTWDFATYQRLVAAGLEGVVHYQETYDRCRYEQVHPAGWKRNFERRLAAMEEAGRAGARRLGLGVLLGLSADWRAELLALGAHAAYLTRVAWRSEVTVSLPRIAPSAAAFRPVVVVSDREYTQAMIALRLFEPTAGIVLSTRESPALRDGLARIAVTHLSAGSSTEPGGYRTPGGGEEQFAVADERSADDVAAMLAAAGYEPVFRDAFPLYQVADEARPRQ